MKTDNQIAHEARRRVHQADYEKVIRKAMRRYRRRRLLARVLPWASA